MSDNYQAVYDAVRSKMGRIDSSMVLEAIRDCFDISYIKPQIKENFDITLYKYQRPSVLFRPKISIDGNQWLALYGDNIQDGVAGFGNSPSESMADFDKKWNAKLQK